MNRKAYRRGVLGTLAQIALLLVALTPNSVAQAAQEERAGIPKTDKQRLAEAYGKIPLNFERNTGQTSNEVEFLSRGPGYTLFLTRHAEAVMVLGSATTQHASESQTDPLAAVDRPRTESTPPSVFRMKFANAQVTPQAEALEELPGKANYFIGNDPKKWRTNVPIFGRVTFHSVYPGVDLAYYGNQQQLEYDFIVAPHADPGSITMAVDGAGMSLDPQGDLVFTLKNREIRLLRPLTYQLVDGNRRKVPSRYLLKGARQVGFELGAYDHNQPLLIDPVLAYSTYLGGSWQDMGERIAVDAAGNTYVTGSTTSPDFPTTTGAFQTTKSNLRGNAFITKLNPLGSTPLVYSTYLGGNYEDGAFGIAVDAAGNAYVTGCSASNDFPTTPGAFQTTNKSANYYNAFVTKLNPTGSALVYSTYLGGSGSDGGRDIALDAAGNAYMTGFTHSNDFPTTASAFQPVKTGLSISNGNAFVTKLNADGTALLYSTYLGGSETAPSPQMQPMNGDQGNSIVVDSAGNVYVAGSACSSDFPTTLLAFQMVYQGSCDAFVTKIDPTGLGPTSLVYSTFLGGISGEVAYGIALDAENNVYATGVTCSPNFPVTPLAFQIVPQGSCDAFVTKLSPTAGSGLVYSTFLGGTRGDNTSGIAVDSAGNAYVTGSTNSTDFPVTPDAFQATKAGDAGTWDAILTVLNPSGSAPLYSTHLGGGTPPDPGASSNSAGTHLALDTNGNVYLTGWTYSISFPTTPGAFQTVNKSLFGEANAFVAKFSGFQTAQ